MSVTEAKQNQNGLLGWVLNAVIVWVALIFSSLVFHAFGNTIESFTTFFNGTSIAVFLFYGLVFAYTYDRISGVFSLRNKRKFISFFGLGLENERARSFSIRMLDGIGCSIGVSIIFWGARYMASGGMLPDADSDGLTDSSDVPTVVIVAVSAAAMAIGGRTESDDDDDDKVAPTSGAKGG